MNRIATIILLMFAVTCLFSCGGGGTTTVGDVDSNTDTDTLIVTPEAPATVYGDHSTSVVPNQVNVLTGASPAELTEQLGEYGMVGLAKTGGWVTVELPSGTDLDWAVQTLKKEYNIAKAEKVNVLNTSRAIYEDVVVDATERSTSYTPFEPGYQNQFYHLGWEDTDGNGSITIDEFNFTSYRGQALAMDRLGYPAAWDVALDGSVSTQEVRVAIIDAGFFNYDATTGWNRDSFDEGQLDADVSGSVASDGTVTTGLAAAEWTLDDDGDPTTADFPYRMTGENILGCLADSIGDPNLQSGLTIRGLDFDGSGAYTSNELWNEGIAGCNPNATYILLKTGQLNVDTWEFTDNHLAAAIEYAAGDPADDNGGLWPNGGCGADIILLGMFANGAVGANVSTAIQTARDNNCLVIAPAGDVIDSGFSGDPAMWGEAPVDISASPVTPASDPNCIAVCGTGVNMAGDLGQINAGGELIDNEGIGWTPWMSETVGLDSGYLEVARWCNSGGDIGAIAFGHGWSNWLWNSGAGTTEDPVVIVPAVTWQFSYGRFRSEYAAAYVAGAASIVHQALHQATGTEPTDDEVWQVINDNAQYAPITGLTAGGLLDAGKSAYDAMSGGNLYTPAMHFTGLTISQPPAELEPGVSVGFSGVVRGATFEVAPTVDKGVAPFTLTVDWDNDEAEVVVDPWVNGDPVTLDGGWDTLGHKGVNIIVTDSNGQEVNWGMVVNVVNPISAGITIEDSLGNAINPANLVSGTTYRFRANLTNVFTGLINDTPNEITLTWDFGDGTPQQSGEIVNKAFTAASTIQLLVEQSQLPSRLFTIDVSLI